MCTASLMSLRSSSVFMSARSTFVQRQTGKWLINRRVESYRQCSSLYIYGRSICQPVMCNPPFFLIRARTSPSSCKLNSDSYVVFSDVIPTDGGKTNTRCQKLGCYQAIFQISTKLCFQCRRACNASARFHIPNMHADAGIRHRSVAMMIISAKW